MPVRDDKPTSQSANAGENARKGRGMPPLLMGIIIGLLLGIILALAVATWLNRANNPFLEKSRPVEALPVFGVKTGSPAVLKNEKGEPEKPRFEFYQILPGDKAGAERSSVGATGATKPTPSLEAKSTARADAATVREAPKTATAETVFLQAGAFQNQTDAENLKAKIAFSGFEATVRPVNLPDKGTLYRVRLGPYKSSDEVNRIKTTLSQNGINAAVVKAAD